MQTGDRCVYPDSGPRDASRRPRPCVSAKGMNGMKQQSSRYLTAAAVLGLLLGGIFPASAETAAENEVSSNTMTFAEYNVYADRLRQRGDAPIVQSVYAGSQISNETRIGLLGDRHFMDVPVNIIGYTAELIEDQQADTLVEVIKNNPSVENQTLSSASTAWSIRGFRTTQQDTQFNGLYGIAPRFYDGVEYVERIDFLLGPNAMLSGIAPNGSVGGTINFIPKRAGEEPITRLSLSYGNGHQFKQNLDIGRRSDDGQYGVRVNLMNRRGSTGIGDERKEANSIVAGFDVKKERFRASVDLGYAYNRVENQQYRLVIDNLITAGGSLPDLDPDTSYGAPGTFRRVTEKFGMARAEYDLNKDWSVYGAFGLRSTSMDYYYNETRVRSGSTTAIQSRFRYNNQINKALSGEFGVKGTVMTGDLKHELNLAASHISYTRYMYNRNTATYGSAGTIVNPDFSILPASAYISDMNWYQPKNDDNTFRSLALTDIITTGDDKWIFMIGGRFQQAKVNTYNTTLNSASFGANTASYKEHAFSPSFGIVHKIHPKTALYANYMQALEVGEQVTDTSAANYGEVFAPYKTKQYEFGAKFDFGSFTSTLSFFNINRPSLIQNTTTTYYELGGETRHKGIELNFFGEPVKGTRLLGGITWLDATYTKTANGSNVGNRVPAVSRLNAVLGLEQDIRSVEGLTLTTRARYTGSSYYNAANTFRLSPFTVWDLGARYKFNAGSTPVTVRADVFNVFDKHYWRAVQSGVFLGDGRTFAISVSADF